MFTSKVQLTCRLYNTAKCPTLNFHSKLSGKSADCSDI